MQLDRLTQLTSYSCRNKTVFCQIFSTLRSKHSFLITGFLSHGQETYLFFYDSAVCAGYFIPWTNYQVLNLEKNKKTKSEPLSSYLTLTLIFLRVFLESIPTHPLPPALSCFLSLQKLMEDGYECMPRGAHSSILPHPPCVCVGFTWGIDASNWPLSMCGGLLTIMMIC